MTKTWILISDAHRARCFERNTADQSLTELADFVFPLATVQQEAAKGHGRTGHAGTQFEPHSEVHAKARSSFARQLASYLNHAVDEHVCRALVLIATSPMLGELQVFLNSGAQAVLKRCVPIDLTHYTGPELKSRVTEALQLPD
jgi:protein required for attachment to host cells